jgi:lipopolysaccharide transport system permease protein
MASKQYYTHISSKHKMFDLKLKEVWQYRDLIWLFTKRSFTVTYKQTVLGPAWLFISPIFTSLIYTFVFGGIAGMDTDGIPQILFYLSGNAMWNLFSSTLKNNSSTFTANAGVFGKVYFPRLTTPISVVMSSIIKFFIHCLLVVLVLGYYVITGLVSPHWEVIWVIPLVLIQLSLMGMGLGIIISSMTTKYRDLSVLVGFGVELLMYATPIVYPLSQLGAGKLKIIVMLNPVTMPMEVYRYALLGQGTINLLYLFVSVLFTFVVLILGIMVFNKVERTFMDTV